ncbi:hypothetical protein IU433_13145 [Nocardia puris]|uniref:DUF7373 family lipoprotein n=1 Tax=Nocardia puris TaxID=208602 RepID=UPI001894EEC8|nr:hypothetical protein [Nocardia puris]MBF6213551.1 hypothetical protein [Nocardia puris]MBF6365519.1 hypothetical protein [Nocardia puris]MBF6459985.1 hypothetical protein [Nocardia puris]
MVAKRPAVRRLGPAAALLSALTVTACSGVAGTPTPAEIDVRTLDVGAYNIEPADVEAIRTPNDGRILEGLRMAGAIAIPHQIDETFVHNWGTDVLESPAKAAQASAISNVNTPTLEKHGMIVAFDIGEGDRAFRSGTPALDIDANLTRVVLFRFPGEAAARDAAREMEALDFSVSPDNEPAPIPDHPGAHAHWRPGIRTIGATYAQGEIVVSVFAQHRTPDKDALADRVAQVLDAQIPLLEEFQPTPPDEIDELPRDPDAMLRRILVPGPAGQRLPISSREYGSWSGRATVHYRPLDNEEMAAAWDDGGVESVAQAFSTTLFRFRDNEAAQAFGDAWADTVGGNVRAVDGPEGLPDVRCVERAASNDESALARCYVIYREHAAFVSGGTAENARQQAAAQYALLVNGA